MELAQERDEDIPALVYEARSTRQPRHLHRPQQQQQQQQQRQHSRHEQNEGRGQQGTSPVAILQKVTVAWAASQRLRQQPQPDSPASHLPAEPLQQPQTAGLCYEPTSTVASLMSFCLKQELGCCLQFEVMDLIVKAPAVPNNSPRMRMCLGNVKWGRGEIFGGGGGVCVFEGVS